eukprot:scaffold273376_cov51-Prasinocladus_malaysianus.AAC.1
MKIVFDAVTKSYQAISNKIPDCFLSWLLLQALDVMVFHPTAPQAADAWCHNVERVFGSINRIELVQYEEDMIMTGPAVEHLFAGARGIPNLQKVNAKVDGLSDAVLHAVAGLTGLKQLRLEASSRLMFNYQSTVTVSGLNSLVSLPKLESLLLSILTCPSEDLMVLTRMTSLKSLKLDTRDSIDSELVRGITSCLTGLTKLELCNKVGITNPW